MMESTRIERRRPGKAFASKPSVAAVMLLLLAGTAAPAAPRWIKLTSSNFELLTSASEKSGRNLVLHFEKVRSFFISTMPSLENAFLPVKIIGFNNDREFTPYRANEFASAFFTEGPQGDLIVMNDISADRFPVAIHEYVHLLVQHSGLKAPPWWGEGLAELFSTLKPVADEVEVGAVLPGRYARVTREPLIPLETLMAVDHRSPYYNDKEKAGMFYAESWALVHMLNLSEKYRPRLTDLTRELQKGTVPEELFRSAYGKTTAQVQQDLEAYLRRTAFNSVRFSIRLEKSAETPEITPADDVEVGVALARILISVDKRDQALQALEDLERSYPDSWQVEETMGYLAWLQGDREAARNHLGRATEAGKAGAKTYLDYSGLMGESGVASATLIPVMEKAYRLYPNNTEVILRLAGLCINDQRFGRVVSLLAGAPSFKKDQAFQALSLGAYAYLGIHEIEMARKFAEDARLYAVSSKEKSSLDQLLRAIDSVTRAAVQPKPQNPLPASGASAGTNPAAPSRPAAPKGPPVLTPRSAQPGIEKPPPVEVTDPEPPAPQVTGRLLQFDCLDTRARLVLDVGGKRMSFLVTDPQKIVIKGIDEATASFTCGPQAGTLLLIRYEAKPDPKLGTVGNILVVEFLRTRSYS